MLCFGMVLVYGWEEENAMSPFKSQAQRAYLFANNPAVAREFARKTKKGAKLPRKVHHAKGRR